MGFVLLYERLVTTLSNFHDYVLDQLKSDEQAAFERKQQAWREFSDLRDRTNDAYEESQRLWRERAAARDEMNREFEARNIAFERSREVWDEYGRIRDANNPQIESLRAQADSEHYQMQQCFEQASSEYSYGDKSLASEYAQEGHEHKERRDELNSEISRLCEEVRNAKQHAEWSAPKPDSSAFNRAKDRFEQAKAEHEAAEREFKSLSKQRNAAKQAFDSAHAEHQRLKEAFERRLEEVRNNRKRERDDTLDKAGVRWSERDSAKIVKKSDGSTQVYHGGIGDGDGYGHGHTVLDSSGRKTYDRDAFAEHGSQNYTEKTGWTKPEHGTIDGHPVTFKQGLGRNSGQTLIADGFITDKQLHKGHNHYGDNDKSRYPNEPDRIEDSKKHKNDHYYTGPGA